MLTALEVLRARGSPGVLKSLLHFEWTDSMLVSDSVVRVGWVEVTTPYRDVRMLII